MSKLREKAFDLAQKCKHMVWVSVSLGLFKEKRDYELFLREKLAHALTDDVLKRKGFISEKTVDTYTDANDFKVRADFMVYMFTREELDEFMDVLLKKAEFTILLKDIELGKLNCDSLAKREALSVIHAGALAAKDAEIALLRNSLRVQ